MIVWIMTPPKITAKDNTENMKHSKEWSLDENKDALGNYHALNAIYNEVDMNVFKISTS